MRSFAILATLVSIAQAVPFWPATSLNTPGVGGQLVTVVGESTIPCFGWLSWMPSLFPTQFIPEPASGDASESIMAPPEEFDLQMNEITRHVTRIPADDQGAWSFVYRVGAPGWPRESNRAGNVAAVAKTPRYNTPNNNAKLAAERDVVKVVGLFVDFGTGSDNLVWLIMNDVVAEGFLPLKTVIAQTYHTRTACQRAVDLAITTAVDRAKYHVLEHGYLHPDLNPGNVFYRDGLVQVELVDWADAKAVPDTIEYWRTVERGVLDDTADKFHRQFNPICQAKPPPFQALEPAANCEHL